MKTRLGSRHIAPVLLVLLVLVPASVSHAQNEEERVEKFTGLAQKAYDKADDLVRSIYVYLGIEGIEEIVDSPDLVGIIQQLHDIDLESISDVQSAKEAMLTLRRLFGQLHAYLEESGVDIESEAQAQGLIVAMERALERIERLEEIAVLSEDTSLLLVDARVYLDITQALELLELGKVNQTAHNLAQANKLIAQAHKALKNTAAEMNTNRIRNYFKVMSNFRERLGRQIEKLKDPEKQAELQAMLDAVSDLFTEAESLSQSEALGNLEQARNLLEDVEQGLKEQRRAEKGNGKGNGGD